MINSTKYLFLITLFISIYGYVSSQEVRSVAEQLGYAKDARLLIMHADDIGVAHSVNSATISAFEKGGISSASIMVPCPWFPEIAKYARENPGMDFGLHLTLTAEWEYFKWDGVLPSNEISSLLDEDGFMYASSEEVAQNADPEEVEKEVRAQVERALAFGIKPTHLDSHMGSLFQRPDLFEIYLKMGEEYGIPVFIPKNMLDMAPGYAEMIGENHIPVDQLFMLPQTPAEGWNEFYAKILNNLEPGLNEIIIHLAYDDAEMQAVTTGHPEFGATWRQNDYDFVVGDEFKKILIENNIHLVTWSEIQKLFQVNLTSQ